MEFVNQLRNGGASPSRTSLPKRDIPEENDHRKWKNHRQLGPGQLANRHRYAGGTQAQQAFLKWTWCWDDHTLKTTARSRCFYFVPTKSGFYQSNHCDFQVKAGKGWLVGSTSPLVSVSKTTCVPNWDACLLHYWQSLGSVLGNWEARRWDLIYEVVYIYIMITIQRFVMAKCSTPMFKFPQVETGMIQL